MFPVRRLYLWLPFTVLACAPKQVASPLYIASEESSGERSQARVHVADNTIVITGYLENGCRPGSGDYLVHGHSVEVRLAGAAQAPCQAVDSLPMYTTRVGPLPPGTYHVTVTVDGKVILSSEPVKIG
ncbi:MAG: hypothetical protein ABI679_08535 [Gemmatimonadota bacterium]